MFRQDPLVVLRTAIRESRLQDEGVGIPRRDPVCPGQRNDKMVLQQFEVAVRVVDGNQSLVDDEEVHPLPVKLLPLHRLKDLRDISAARHRQIYLLPPGQQSPEPFTEMLRRSLQKPVLILFLDDRQHSLSLRVVQSGKEKNPSAHVHQCMVLSIKHCACTIPCVKPGRI